MYKRQCHYCGYTQKNYQSCPACGSPYIRYFGAGTQKLEDELQKRFEGIKTVRMDFDTTSTKHAHEKLLKKFETEKADVLIGTQMVSKGLDIPAVTLVGVCLLYSSHFTEMERILSADKPAGSKLDLLIQEINREVNTIG